MFFDSPFTNLLKDSLIFSGGAKGISGIRIITIRKTQSLSQKT